ncbi:MAG TPA: imidazole glycerol phosphate synthase subunit HisH [Syntrophorhabdaceae bacterium]|nr:imidazole glycerol phosphate synthase subunit HisH [Syntrophorhabdaceae bacterium]HQM81549.1 imidazole glycerol phosphate synthase subunit HisH [Syntrophorhabdaceae bacterium]
MIAIVDYGMGNLKSVANVFKRLGADVAITREKEVILSSGAIVLPGVGAFGKCIENLEKLGLLAFLRKTILDGKPYLGICLGMQVLFENSEEAPGVKGMGIIRGGVPRFRGRIKVPHMGWNSIEVVKEAPVLKEIATGEHFYFVHSYYCLPEEDVTATRTEYGGGFASSIAKDNIFACQFHPEKSQRAGQALLKNFISINA